mmetsp:Transcript_8229/g.30522  ORF Transcript_8229/g.30522 Transcript_8229/m.30522 type:complete len:299 (+) Transcript_8229:931-1827(+)
MIEEISIKYDSNSAWFHSVKAAASSSLVKPPTVFNTSYASEINCMSPYSIPLCTILTKLPAPPGPTYVTHAPESVCADTGFKISAMMSYASFEPPGIIDGPLRAPSSPPLTPIPRYKIPRSSTSFARRSVFSYHSFPPSMMQSPGSRNWHNPAIVASTGAPALTKMITHRGFANDATKSFISWYPRNFSPKPSFPARATATSVLSLDRLYTEIAKPFSAMFSARFCPITANPHKPMRDFSPSSPPARTTPVAPRAIAVAHRRPVTALFGRAVAAPPAQPRRVLTVTVAVVVVVVAIAA